MVFKSKSDPTQETSVAARYIWFYLFFFLLLLLIASFGLIAEA